MKRVKEMRHKRQNHFIARFFWFCAGAHPKIILRNDSDLDQGRYAAMGVTVLITATTAGLAGGYTFYTVFPSLQGALICGVLTGITIGSFDRLFIITTHPGTSLEQILTALLRLIIAILLSLMMAIPLQLQLFAPQINAEIQRQNLEAVREVEEDLTNNLEEKINQLQESNEEKRERLKRKDKEVEQAYEQAKTEAEGNGGTGIRGQGPVYEQKWNYYQTQKREYEQLKKQIQPQIEENNKRIQQLREQYREKVKEMRNVQQEADGLLAQLQALYSLVKREPIIKIAIILSTLFLVVIDIFPILSKLLSPSGQYDNIFEAEEQETKLRQQQKKKDLQEQINRESELNRKLQEEQDEFTMRAYFDIRGELENHPAWREFRQEAMEALIERYKANLFNKTQNYKFSEAEL